MTMVCGLDLHRRQITFDALEVESGQVWTGRVWQPDRERLRRWLREDVTEHAHGGAVAFAVEGCTGWRYVVEEVVAAGFRRMSPSRPRRRRRVARKRRAKTDRSDAGCCVSCWSRGGFRSRGSRRRSVLEARALVRLYKDLLDERTGGCSGCTPSLYQHGGAPDLTSDDAATGRRAHRRPWRCPPAVGTAVDVAMRQVDRLTEDMTRVRSRPPRSVVASPPAARCRPRTTGSAARCLGGDLGGDGRHPPVPQLRRRGPPRRLDVTVYSSDRTPQRRAPGPARTADAALGAV